MKRLVVKCVCFFEEFDYKELSKDEKDELYCEFNYFDEPPTDEISEEELLEETQLSIVRDSEYGENEMYLYISGIYKDDVNSDDIIKEINDNLKECLFDNIIE